jgi:hypothetical protein
MSGTVVRFSILIFFLFLFSSISLGCQNKDSVYYTDPDRRVAEMIFDKRIVMIGEGPHSHPVGFDGTMTILYEWLKQVVDDASKPQNLTLILETDSAYAVGIQKYFDTGIIDSILNPGMPIENYEFFANLRHFHNKIDSINKANSSPIKFTVRGFEEVGVNFNADFMLKTQKESELWFVNERDVNTSKGIIDYVHKHPEEQIVIFYGGSHLQEGLVNKNLGFPDLSDEECMGYYLIYYLRKEFGKENVVSVSQPIIPPIYLVGTAIEKATDRSIFISHKNLQINMFRPKDYEYFILRPYKISIPFSAGCSFSRVMIEKSISTLKQCEPVLSGYKTKGLFGSTMFYTWLLTGIRFKDTEGLEKWYNKNGYAGFERLNSRDFKEQIFNSLFGDSENNLRHIDNFTYMLSELGFSDQIQDTSYGTDSSVWKEHTWPQEIGKVVFLNSIGIYWFGYPDEKIKAKEYLVKFSGEDFAEPEKYLQWYRMKYYGYEY